MCWRNLTILTSAILLGACGGGSTDLAGGSTSANTTANTTAATTEPTAEPTATNTDTTQGGSETITMMVPTELVAVDRHSASTTVLTYYADKAPTLGDIEFGMEITGSAIPNEDYILNKTDKIVFKKGEKTAQLEFTVIHSNLPKGKRTLNIRFFNDKGDEATQKFIISADASLNDTGITTFSDETNYALASEPSSTHPNQDAGSGHDVVNLTDTTAPYYKNATERDSTSASYLGQAGFRYKKLDIAGNRLPSNATNWRCVKDEITGITWERKSANVDLSTIATDTTAINSFDAANQFNAFNFNYMWLNNDEATNGGAAGKKLGLKDATTGEITALDVDKNKAIFSSSNCAYSARSSREFELYCSTEQYVKEANLQGICGYTDWNVPSVSELRSVFNYGSTEATLLEDHFFFDSPADSSALATTTYWTSNTSASNPASAWCFDIKSGDLKLCAKGTEKHRLIISRRD